MLYVFKDNVLIKEINPINRGRHPRESINITIPPGCYVYNGYFKTWEVRNVQSELRPIQLKHVPKDLKALCLLLNIH